MKNLKKYIFVGLAILFVAWGSFALYKKYAPRDFNQIKKSGLLRIATEYNSIGFFVSGDTISGFQSDLIKLLEKRFQIKVEIYPVMGLQESMKGLSERRFDIIARPIPITTELRQHYLLTSPIMYNKQVLVQRRKGAGKPSTLLRNQVNLIKRTIYVSKHSQAIVRLRNLSSEIGDTIYVKEFDKYSDEQLIALVAKGEIDYAVCDESLARKMQKQYPEIDTETDISFTQFQAWVLRKESTALLDSINLWLSEIKKSKQFKAIYQKYY